jgi:hypothetical protein
MNNLISTDVFDNPKSLITKLDFVDFDDSLSNFESNTISIAITIDEKESIRNNSGILIEEHVFSLLVAEINQHIYKEITKKLFDTAKFDYIDLNKGNYINQMQAQISIVDKIVENKQEYSSLIATGMISSELYDVDGFNVTPINNSGAMIYPTGNLMGIGVYVDPYMRYNDGLICLLDKVRINVKDFEFKTDFSVATFAPRTLVKYDLSIDVGDSKIIFIIGSDFEDTSGQLKKLRRDIKINNILDGK